MRHNNSKKHNRLERENNIRQKNGEIRQKNGESRQKNGDYNAELNKQFICEYCNKPKNLSHKSRHYLHCKAKKDTESNELKKKIEELKKENKRIEQLEEENKELREIEKDFLKFMKDYVKTLQNTNNTVTNINSNNDNRQYNMFYIINNYKDAHNIEDLINSPLTKEEKQYILDNGSTLGCYIQYKYCI
jgi:vacuolar-type H+-ATPase subunit I/STV1